MPIPKGMKRKRIKNWRKFCAKGSIRTVKSGKARILVCCPKGKWKKRAKRCIVGTRAVSIDKPRRGFGSLRVPSGYEVPMSLGSRIPYTVFRQSQDYLYGWNWRNDETGKTGLGYRTKTRATDAAISDAVSKRGGRL